MSGGGNNVSRFSLPFGKSARRRNEHAPLTVTVSYFHAAQHIIGHQEIQNSCTVEDFGPEQMKLTFKTGLLHGKTSRLLRKRIQGIIQDDVNVPERHLQDAATIARTIITENGNVYITFVENRHTLEIFSEEWEVIDRVKKRLLCYFRRTLSTNSERRRFGIDRVASTGDLARSVRQSLGETTELTSISIEGKLLTIKTYKCSASISSVDAIVNPSPEQLMHGAGHSGQQMSITDLSVTSGKDQKLVFHLGGLCARSTRNKSRFADDLLNVILKCLCEARNRSLTSLAIPFLTSALEVLTPERCAQVYLRAVRSFDTAVEGGSLREVHFVDNSDGMVSIFRKEMDNSWSKPGKKDLETDTEIIISFLKPTTE